MKKILIVDDSSTNNLLFHSILEEEGYKVVEAVSGKTALKKIQTQKPDLILLDIMMPGMTGFEVLEIIKNTEEVSSIPVIMVSAKQGKNDKQKAEELGAVDYIMKPIVIPDLLERIQNAL